MFNDEKINESHHHLQNSRKFKSWFRSSIHKHNFKRFDQHDSLKKKFCWDRLNKIRFENTLNQKFSNISSVVNTQFLNDYIMNVCKIIIQIIKIFILKTAISVKITLRFDDKCKDVRIKINQTKKILQQSLTENANEEIIEKFKKHEKESKATKREQ